MVFSPDGSIQDCCIDAHLRAHLFLLEHRALGLAHPTAQIMAAGSAPDTHCSGSVGSDTGAGETARSQAMNTLTSQTG
jgi:hypothetical protein